MKSLFVLSSMSLLVSANINRDYAQIINGVLPATTSDIDTMFSAYLKEYTTSVEEVFRFTNSAISARK
jgi:hypothetical protein